MPQAPTDLMRLLYAEHATSVWRYAFRLTGDRNRADDVTQEVLLRAWNHRKVLDQTESSARAWLFTVARNLVFDEGRSARSRREVGMSEPPDRGQEDGSDSALDAWLMADALGRLAPDHRAVIVHSYYRGMSTRQIAAELDIPEGTVKSRMHYGMRALRLALQEMGVTR
ncbi:RNA polymerase subunit sigma [Rhodococcus sp. 14-2483-1-1]|uniref:sigma-70 family RNA polymerase sigma factor n=1 Tax=Rhodococcus sp. 14-2483-1-1 TaxID=2023148 RepID=UPI000B9B5AC8|nr:sigma-70 family RNA polymerase sigma factor [Rhodococcus sp. 14-2483-1-1]OZF37962.1 RNA polymerase subunit sigma [Rhodococcus sp. 14-2483-1-1]